MAEIWARTRFVDLAERETQANDGHVNSVARL